MLKYLAHDTVNDVAIIQTSFGINVRYGLQVKLFDTVSEAIREFKNCQLHALTCEGHVDCEE